MEELDMNILLDRVEEETRIISILNNFEATRTDLSVKKGLYIYGNPGSGKTHFIINLLKKLNYDIVKYDAGDVRNKNIIDTITKHNMSDKNIMSMFHKVHKPIAIIMDEIDGMNSGDKGGINSLIKIIRPKKTKKQRLEEITNNPIICIGNFHIDKKFKELMKVCHSIELKKPTDKQISSILHELIPSNYFTDTDNLEEELLSFIK
jgi:replication factor C subunit 1